MAFKKKSGSRTIKVINKVASWCANQRPPWDGQDFLSKCLVAKLSIDGKTLAVDTIQRVFEGETNIHLTTAMLVVASLGVEFSEVFEIQE